MRLDKLLSNLKYGSRSDIKKMCKESLIVVNGKVAKDSGMQINELNDVIYVGDKKVFYKEKITLMINKPQGYICSNIDEEYPSLLNLLPEELRRFDFSFAGRLDYDTEGLVIVTTDGQLVHKIITPKKDIYKTYYLKSLKTLTNLDLLENGVRILDGANNYYVTEKAFVDKISDNEMFLSIKEGKYHQVKRMLEYIGNEVTYLKRVKVGKLELGDIKLGQYIEINEDMIF